jgi:hypothetical protein
MFSQLWRACIYQKYTQTDEVRKHDRVSEEDDATDLGILLISGPRQYIGLCKKSSMISRIYPFYFPFQTGCCSLVVVLLLSNRKVVSPSPARAGRVKPKTFKIGKWLLLRQEHVIPKWEWSRVFRIWSFKRRSRVAVGVERERTLTAKSRTSAKHRSKFAALSPVMVTVAR